MVNRQTAALVALIKQRFCQRALQTLGLPAETGDQGQATDSGCLMPLQTLWRDVNFTPNPVRKRIRHVNGPLYLPAGPGSGKTRAERGPEVSRPRPLSIGAQPQRTQMVK